MKSASLENCYSVQTSNATVLNGLAWHKLIMN